MLEPKIYAKIKFKNIRSRIVVLPGDQIRTRFSSSYTDQDEARFSPQTPSNDLPDNIRQRFTDDNLERNECENLQIADSIQCSDYVVHCTDPNDRILFTIQGAREVYVIDKKCHEFMEDYIEWDRLQDVLHSDIDYFT